MTTSFAQQLASDAALASGEAPSKPEHNAVTERMNRSALLSQSGGYLGGHGRVRLGQRDVGGHHR